MKDKETPLKLVRLWNKMIPGIYETLDCLHSVNGHDGLHWSDYCALPISVAFTCLVEQHNLAPKEASPVAAELTACWTWRQNKIVYAFDPDFAAALASQAEDISDNDKLPTELLYRLPYPCIYIKANIFDKFDGFWCWIEHDMNENHTEFRIQWVDKGMDKSFPLVLHLIPGATLEDCIIDTAKESISHMNMSVQQTTVEMNSRLKKEAMTILKPMQLVLYLLSERADVIERREFTAKKEKNGVRIIHDIANEIKEYDVGVRIGSAIRKSKVSQNKSVVSKNGTSKRPHSRRGHWHRYWTGSTKKGERKLVLQWTAPTFIHAEMGMNENKVIIYPVKDK